ncbi:MAG: hypothetical protein VCC04_04070 [Myxococcota bacterium]
MSAARPLHRLAGMGALVALLASAGAQADLRRLEVVGAVPIHQGDRQRSMPKDRAVQQGLVNGVSRVGADILLESLLLQGGDRPESTEGAVPDFLQRTPLGWHSPAAVLDPAQELERGRIRQALGNDMVPYTKSFRILEDQGERPVLFTQHPDAATEYVVVMEIQVEVDRVRQRLEEVGLIEPRPIGRLEGIELVLRGVQHYSAYQAVVDLLLDPAVAAAVVTPESFEAGRIQLRVEGEWNASELSERLQSAAPAELVLVPLEIENAEEADGFWTWGGVVRPRLALAVGVRESPGEAPEGQPVP